MSKRNDAAPITAQANAALRNNSNLNWDDPQDLQDATRGFIAKLDEPVIRDEKGNAVWDLNQYAFLENETAPATVNPSLWRQARLNMQHGLFQVADRIYQARGHDLSVMSFIQTDTGYIVIDPLISAEVAKASLDLVYRHVGERPVVAVIYTHSHIDHWGGVKGVVTEEDVNAGKVKIIAPEGFLQAAISENVIAGNVMGRRAAYMYGSLLPKDEKGQVDAGLGKTTSNGTVTLIAPTDTISRTGTEMNVDGVQIVFQVTPGTEAPAEMNFYFPQFRALCMAENCTHNLHNLYTLRGAEVRDAKAWAEYLTEAIQLFGNKSDVVFTSHHWPVWGARGTEYMSKQRDMYKYLHDQTLRLANEGYTMLEIAEMIELPPALAKEWFNRGYYGSINHNVKAIYQKYIGFFDGNPANLHPLPPEQAGKRYVEFMGGADAVLEKARAAFERGEYRWVAQVVNHVVFADPNNAAARNLQADALEQLGYLAESGPWRNFYLTGAQELREGVASRTAPRPENLDAMRALTIEMIFDSLGVRLNGPKAEGKTLTFNWNFTDENAQYVLTLQNSVLNYVRGEQAPNADASFTLTKAALNQVLSGMVTPQQLIASGALKFEGDPRKLGELFALLDQFEFGFNIVTP